MTPAIPHILLSTTTNLLLPAANWHWLIPHSRQLVAVPVLGGWMSWWVGGTGCGVGSKGYMAGWRSQLYSQHYSPPGLGHGATDGGAGFGAYHLPNDLSPDSLLWCYLFSSQFSILELLVRAWSGAVGAAVVLFDCVGRSQLVGQGAPHRSKFEGGHSGTQHEGLQH